MVISKRIDEIHDIMIDAARNRTFVFYDDLISIFPQNERGDRNGNVYDTLELACRKLCERAIAIYESLLAKRDNTNLPGSGFFDIFRNHRNKEYAQIAGDAHVAELTLAQKQQIVEIERLRVYNHASNFPV